MDIHDNHFALFGLPDRFDLDTDALDRAYRDLQARVHPDRFAGSGAAEQRVALQWATRANEAYRVLRDPLQRAMYLCTLRGADPADERDTTMPPAFLMQQLAWREALDDARAAAGHEGIAQVRAQLDAKRAELVAGIGEALDRDGDTPRAAARVREWMFVERLGDEVRSLSRAAVH